ncbi:MAG: polysaccharide biosynthesis tyrosine autokinase [Aggregatilineales bacterium]
MTLDQNIRLFRKWWWLIVAAAVVAGIVGYLLRNRQTPTYQASAILAFGNVIGNTSLDTGNFIVGSDLAQTYSELIKTNTIINDTLNTLHLPISTDELRNAVDDRVIPNTALLQIIVTYNDPVLAASITNAILDELLLNAPADISPDQKQQIQQITDQIGKLNTEIADTENRLANINSNLQAAQTAADITDLTAQRDVAANQIASLRATLAQFENTLTQLQGRRNTVEVYERATAPTAPLENGALQSGLLAAAVAASLTVGIVLLVTYFDNGNVHTEEEISKALELPVLGTIVRYGSSRESYHEKLVTRQPLRAEVLETYRLLFTRLMMAPQRNGQDGVTNDTFLVSSPAPGDGKSVVSANLAVTAALFGMRVLLIDADLRQPTLHKFFGLPNDTGLTKLIANAAFVSYSALPIADAQDELIKLVESAAYVSTFSGQPRQSTALHFDSELASTIEEYIQRTELANLSVITTGPITSTSAEEMGLVFQPQWITTLKACAEVDVIIIDTPPCLAVADSSVLAAKTGARIVLVLAAGRTAIRTAIKAKDQFVKVGANPEGVVLNMVDSTDNEFDYKNYGASGSQSKK